MGFLKRLLGAEPSADATGSSSFDPAEAEAEERKHELDILRDEQERLDDLAQRQLRYAKYAWQPPAQGGERRADDRDKTTSG
jgi:hypothetical protein